MDEAAAALAALEGRHLVGIDGLPCAGKSTLVEAVLSRHRAEVLRLDDFVRPPAEWPSRTRPAYPFEYIRYDEFVAAVQALAAARVLEFRPFDWSTLGPSDSRRIDGSGLVLVEGVSALAPGLADAYDLKIFVDSDRTTVLAAAAGRGIGPWAREWETLFLPSADIYMAGRPQDRADWIVAGRGVAL
jgi:uridine kinase